MSETVLIAETGRRIGSSDSRRLRAEDQIPAVVYGHGMDPISVAVNRRELRVALSGSAGLNTIIDLTVDGKVYPSLIKDIQRHPVKRNVQHIDFIQVNLNEEITIGVPIVLEGEAKDVLVEQRARRPRGPGTAGAHHASPDPRLDRHRRHRHHARHRHPHRRPHAARRRRSHRRAGHAGRHRADHARHRGRRSGRRGRRRRRRGRRRSRRRWRRGRRRRSLRLDRLIDRRPAPCVH